MKSMFAAEAAILLHFEPVRIILFVLLCVIVSLLALAAHQSNLDSCVIGHLFFGTSLINLPERFTSGVRTSLRAQFLGAGKLKKALITEVELLYHSFIPVSRLFSILF